jgi:Na+/phosphate symporter
MFPLLLIIAFGLIARNYIVHNKKVKQEKAEDQLSQAESTSIQGVIEESAGNIASVVKRGNKIYSNSIKGLSKQDLTILKKCKKDTEKLSTEVDDLRDNIFYFIKNLDEMSVNASSFYINILGYLQDMTQSLEFVVKATNKHVNNNHKKLKNSQVKELKEVENALDEFFSKTKKAFDTLSFDQIAAILNDKELFVLLNEKIQAQVERTRTEESSPKNTTLYFGLLLETKDLLKATMSLIQEYFEANQSSLDAVDK